MKGFLWGLVIVIILAVLGFGGWGYMKAQEVKKQGKAIEQITAETLNLQPVSQNEAEISLSAWKNLAEKAPTVINELEKITAAPSDLKEKASQFYSAKAQDKYKEAQYLQFLLDGQRKLGLKENQPKSKGQIETVLTEFDKMQANLSQSGLSLGPDFNAVLAKVQQEAPAFRQSAADIASKMNFSSPAVQLSSAGLDKAVDDLKQAITKSLNDCVDLQNKIKDDISDMANTNWVNPLIK